MMDPWYLPSLVFALDYAANWAKAAWAWTKRRLRAVLERLCYWALDTRAGRRTIVVLSVLCLPYMALSFMLKELWGVLPGTVEEWAEDWRR